MIKNFKLFENTENRVTIVLNDIVNYFNSDEGSIREFIFNLFNYNNNIIEFDCKRCTEMVNGTTNFRHINSHHKGVIKSIGYGFDENDKKIHLSLGLKRIKYDHEVDTDSPMTIFGNIDNDIKNIISEVNIKREANKFNI